jgi:hypothetical protein
MPGLVESFAVTIGWRICECNVIVEGTSDVELLWLAAALYYRKYNTAVLGDRMSILPAGKGDNGGVDGVNRRLNAARQMADADRGPDGNLRHRFIGLYDRVGLLLKTHASLTVGCVYTATYSSSIQSCHLHLVQTMRYSGGALRRTTHPLRDLTGKSRICCRSGSCRVFAKPSQRQFWKSTSGQAGSTASSLHRESIICGSS